MLNISTSIQTITPAHAAELLNNNTHNRAPSRNTVEMYAREMSAGAWKLTGESIKVAADGTILDGQHRLMACVKAGAAFTTMVVHGIDRDAQFNMDQGQRRRAGQQLSLKGHKNASTKAAAARILIAWEGGRALGTRSTGRVSVTETLGLIQRWPTIDDGAKLAKRIHDHNRGLIPTSVLAAFITLALSVEPTKAREFAGLIESGAGMPIGHPVLVLRNQCASYALQRKELTNEDLMAWLVFAWVDFLNDHIRRGSFKRGTRVWDFPGLPSNQSPNEMDIESKGYVTVREAAESTGVGRSTISTWIRDGLVDAWQQNPSRVRSKFYVSLEDIEREGAQRGLIGRP